MSSRTVILISGSGTNLQSFIDKVAAGELDLDLRLVFSNRPDAFGLERASKAGIPTACIEHGDFADRESFDRAVAAVIDEYDPELIILAGFMRILSPWFVRHYEGKVLNIHPALLPKYPGLNTHQRALDSGDEWHGSTVHFVTEELDGGPLIIQAQVPVLPGDDPEILAARVLRQEHRIYPRAVQWFAQGRLRLNGGRVLLDGQPLDGPALIEPDSKEEAGPV